MFTERNVTQRRTNDMMISPDMASPCEGCGWQNFVLRKRCCHCGASLVQHPDRDIDIEVRQDRADALRYETNVGMTMPWEAP
jgi:hypothetical protein